MLGCSRGLSTCKICSVSEMILSLLSTSKSFQSVDSSKVRFPSASVLSFHCLHNACLWGWKRNFERLFDNDWDKTAENAGLHGSPELLQCQIYRWQKVSWAQSWQYVLPGPCAHWLRQGGLDSVGILKHLKLLDKNEVFRFCPPKIHISLASLQGVWTNKGWFCHNDVGRPSLHAFSSIYS